MPDPLSTEYKIHDLWVTSNGHFTLNFHYYEPRFSYIFTVESLYTRDQRRCAEADRDPQNIWNPRKKTADLS